MPHCPTVISTVNTLECSNLGPGNSFGIAGKAKSHP
jgi:hypothetical protein